MQHYIKTPDGNAINASKIGGVKATKSGLVILGNGPSEVLELYSCPPAVAIEWRNAIIESLSGVRPNRSLPDIDWMALARAVAPEWVATKRAG